MHVAIVEDDDMIGDILKTMLERHGFDVSIVTTAFSARNLLHLPEIDLFICDLQLPDGSGVDLCREFLQINPGCKLILMSGAIAAAQLDDLAMSDGREIPVLRKPFLLSQFLDLAFSLCGKPESNAVNL